MEYKITSAEGIISFIDDIEQKFNPQGWSWMGIDIWPVLRVNLYYELSFILIGGKAESSEPSDKIKRILKALFCRNTAPVIQKDVLLIPVGISCQQLNGKLYEKFCDPVIEILNNKGLTWTKWNVAGEVKGEWLYKPFVFNASLDYIQIKSKLKGNPVVLSEELQTELHNFTDFLSVHTQGKLNWTVAGLKEKFYSFQSLVSFFRKYLEKINPKLVFIVSFYSDRGMALIKACRELNIQTADIQHGVQGNLHAVYSFWRDLPAKGYNTLPNDYLVWTNSDVETINGWTKDSVHNVIKTGNLFEEKWYGNDSLVMKEDKFVSELINGMKGTQTVLFTLQCRIDYSEDILKFIKLSQDKFNWLIRLHPIMQNGNWKNDFIQRLSVYGITNYEIENTSELPLYALLRNINIHVTHSSSTVIEALHFGIQSILLDSYGASLFKTEVSNNEVGFPADTHERLTQLNLRAKSSYIRVRAASGNPETSNTALQMMRNYISNKYDSNC